MRCECVRVRVTACKFTCAGRVIYYLIALHAEDSQLDVQELGVAVGSMLQHMHSHGVRSVATTRNSLCSGGDGRTSIDAGAAVGSSSEDVGGPGAGLLNDRWESEVGPAVSQVLNSHPHARPADITTPLELVVYTE